jgi:hypothetical protein
MALSNGTRRSSVVNEKREIKEVVVVMVKGADEESWVQGPI